MINPRELEEEKYVRKLFFGEYAVELRKVPESDEKTFDYELLSSGERVAAVEVKRMETAPRTAENGWKPTARGGRTRSRDNGPARVGRAIHEKYKQLATAACPKVLVFVNDESLVDALDLKEAVDGYLVYGDGAGRFKNEANRRVALGDIRDEKFKIDLYVWINRYDGRFSSRADGRPLPKQQERGPFFFFATDAGYELARKYFRVRETPKPDGDPDADVPTYAEMLWNMATGPNNGDDE